MMTEANCNSRTPDESMDKSLTKIANTEAGTDVTLSRGAIEKAALINSGGLMAEQGVTDDAPYQDIAEYKMVAYLDDDENENKKNLFNTHGS